MLGEEESGCIDEYMYCKTTAHRDVYDYEYEPETIQDPDQDWMEKMQSKMESQTFGFEGCVNMCSFGIFGDGDSRANCNTECETTCVPKCEQDGLRGSAKCEALCAIREDDGDEYAIISGLTCDCMSGKCQTAIDTCHAAQHAAAGENT